MDNNLLLKNGSRIAIIGGGPGGSFFAHFASRYAKEAGIDVSIKIYDKKSFCQRGPRGCNMCAGVISENLYNSLEEEGINIADFCVQRKIEGYCFQTQDESVVLHHPTPGHIPRIVTVFRGNGPLQSEHEGNISFDDYLLDHVKEQGVEIISNMVKDFRLPVRKGDPVKLIGGERNSEYEFEADLVVGAFGVNTGMMEKVSNMGFGYRSPKTVRTCQCEIILSSEYIEETFGNNVFVFALGNSEIKFASITPKADYVTVNLVGRKDLTRNNLIDFLSHPTVKKLMPSKWRIPNSFCMCISKIPITYAKYPYADRVVVLGDASISRSYKSGIESAFNMAKMSAYTAFKNGVSSRSFMNGYFKPAKKLLARDNFYGIMMLKVNDYISSSRHLANKQVRLVKSSDDVKTANKINEILWNMLTGNVSYKEIFLKTLSLRLMYKVLPLNPFFWIRKKSDMTSNI